MMTSNVALKKQNSKETNIKLHLKNPWETKKNKLIDLDSSKDSHNKDERGYESNESSNQEEGNGK